jgi:hypothetical protein
VRRVKNGKPAAHPICGDELRALRELRRNQAPASPLANAGHDTRGIQDYLGHKAIQHTVRYTEDADQIQRLLALKPEGNGAN